MGKKMYRFFIDGDASWHERHTAGGQNYILTGDEYLCEERMGIRACVYMCRCMRERDGGLKEYLRGNDTAIALHLNFMGFVRERALAGGSMQ
jgi:hypothetical protein